MITREHDLHTVPQILRDLGDYLPGAQRASVMTREGDRWVCKVSVGSRGCAPQARAELPVDLARGAGGVQLVERAAWEGGEAPGEPWTRSAREAGALLLIPLLLHGAPDGVLLVEQSARELPPPALQRHLLREALVLGLLIERQRQQQETIQVVQELRLLNTMLGSLSGQPSVEEMLTKLGESISDMLPHQHWSTLTIGLCDPQRQGMLRYCTPVHPTSTYWRNVNGGVAAAARDLDVSADFWGMTLDTDPVAVIDAAIQQGFDAIAVAPIDAARVEPAIRRARAAGIPVIAIDTPPLEDSQALLYVGTDNHAAGRVAGEIMLRLLPEGGSVASSVITLQPLNVCQRLAGFREVVEQGGVGMRPTLEDFMEPQRISRLARQELSEHPEINGAFCACGANSEGWLQALEDLGRQGELQMLCFDLSADSVGGLASGSIQAVVAQREYVIGYRSVELLARLALEGSQAVLASLPGRCVDTGVDVITLDRTPWSVTLADYLQTPPQVVPDRALRQRVAGRGRRPRLLVLGMIDYFNESGAVQQVPFEPGSLIGAAVGQERALVLDPSASEPGGVALEDARRRGSRTLMAAPLRVGQQALGALQLESARTGVCGPGELAQIQRIADVAAVILANTRLFQQVVERTHALEQANRSQELLLHTVMEISSPVVPIARHILVMPLIGTIDPQRAERFTETLLSEIRVHQARVILIDITGVSVVDTAVADYLLRAAQASRLLGAEAVLVGITAHVAQTMVSLGVDLTRLVTRANLESGFAYALARTGAQLRYTAV